MAARQGSRSKNTTADASLLEQVRLLKIENETLRSFIAEKGFGGPLQPQTGNVDSKSNEKRSRRGSVSASAGRRSPNLPTTPRTPFISGKGCSCKGNCSTKVCGCVKKNVPCAEFCRCGSELCQNSEPDKENIGDSNTAQLSKDGEESLRKLSKLTLGDKKEPKKKLAELLPENKPLGKVIKPRSIFSPDVADDVFTFEDVGGEELENVEFSEDNEGAEGSSAEKKGKGRSVKEEPAKKSKKKNDKKTENSKVKNNGAANKQTEPLDAVLSDNAMDEHPEPKLSNRSKKNVEKKGKATGKQSNQVDSKPRDEPTQDDKHSEPEPTKKGKKKVEIKEKTNATTGKRNNKISSDEMEVEDSQENEHSEPETTNKIKKIVDTKTTGAAKKRNNRISSEEMEAEDSQENESPQSKTSKPANKNKKKVQIKGKPTAAQKKQSHHTSEDEASQDTANSELESELPNKHIKVSKKATTSKKAAGKRNNRVDSQDEEEEVALQKNESSDSDSEPKKRRNNRIYSENADEDSQDTDNSEYEPERHNKNKKDTKKASGAVEKRNNVVDSEGDDDDDEMASQDNENSESDQETANKNKKKVENKGLTAQKKRINRIYSKDTGDASEDIKNSESEPELANENKKTVQASEKADKIERNENQPVEMGESSSKNDYLSPTGSDASSSLSYGTDTLAIPEVDDFNPMKPRRQLSRSPLAPRTERPQRIDISNVPLPIPVKEEPEEEVPPPAELDKDIVDNWKEHLAQLVKCSKCGRTFHPYRIKKHELHCIKI